MRLWTIQTRELFDTLMRQGYVYCDRIGYYNENNPEAYQWMCEQMRQRIGEPPLPEIKYPLWAYYQYNCRKDRQPKYELGSEEKEGVYMEIDLPESDVLLSDLSSWTFAALNGWHWGKNKRLERRIDALRAEGIGVNVHYIPVYFFPYYRKLGYTMGSCPNAEKLYERIISIPLFYSMTDKEQNKVINTIKKVIDYYKKR